MKKFPENLDTIKFAIIGAQKSATTSIQYFLHNHPSVNLPLGEIACFESPDYEQGRVLDQMNLTGCVENKIFGIKRPTIFSDYLAVNRLKLHSPSCRLILVCRDPIDRFVSAYFHLMNSGKIPVKEINTAVREIFFGKYLNKYAAGISLLRNGLYADALANIVNNYGTDCLYVTSQERIKIEYDVVIAEICDFLKIEIVQNPPSKERTKNAGRYDYRRARFLKISNVLKYKYSQDRTRKEYRNSVISRTMGGVLSSMFGHWPFSAPIQTDRILDKVSNDLLSEYYESDRTQLANTFPKILYW